MQIYKFVQQNYIFFFICIPFIISQPLRFILWPCGGVSRLEITELSYLCAYKVVKTSSISTCGNRELLHRHWCISIDIIMSHIIIYQGTFLCRKGSFTWVWTMFVCTAWVCNYPPTFRSVRLKGSISHILLSKYTEIQHGMGWNKRCLITLCLNDLVFLTKLNSHHYKFIIN